MYKYGTMKSSKTAELLMNAHNYEDKGVSVFLMTPKTDTRSGVNTIASRVGISSLVLIILSPFIALFGANAVKLQYSTPESWWELYKSDLITLCTDSLPIVVFLRG